MTAPSGLAALGHLPRFAGEDAAIGGRLAPVVSGEYPA